MKDDTEAKLLEYLDEAKKSDVMGTLRTIASAQITHESKDEVRHEEIKGELRGHSLRIGSLEKDIDKTENKLEQSGSWQLEAERSKAIVSDKEATWWKEKAITVIVGLVMLLLGGVVTFLLNK